MGVDLDVDEDVEAGDGGGVDGDQAAVAVVDEEVGAEGGGRKVVNAAGAVGDIAEDEALGDGGEGGEYVGEDQGVHEEAFRQLEGDALGVGGTNPPDALVDLKVVVGGEQGDGGVERCVFEDGVRYWALHKTLRCCSRSTRYWFLIQR